MKILMIHNFYQQRGGEGISFAAEVQALRNLGHEVDTYTVDSALDLSQNGFKLAIDTIWSLKSYRAVRDLLRQKQYDLLHVQNFFPLLSPSVYDAARSCGVPVVQALRNYRPFCMQAGLLRDGKICEDCSAAGSAFLGIRRRCYRGSRSASLAMGAFLEFHRLRKTWHRRVDAYFAVSGCVKEKYVSNGWNPDSIFVKHNTVFPIPLLGKGDGGYFSVVGRLSDDKGLFLLIDAWEILAERMKSDDLPHLKIIGDGPLFGPLLNMVNKRGLSTCIELTGRLSLNEAYDAMGESVATIQPSVRYEPCSRTIAESLAKGTPVIAAQIGAAPELLEGSGCGLLFPPGDAGSLADAVLEFQKNFVQSSKMRTRAREHFDENFSPQKNAEQLIEVYQMVLQRNLEL